MAAAIAQTIAVVDKSGKVVSTSKQLKNVFMEAKLAYQERKAEIVAERKIKTTPKETGDLRRAVTDLRLEDSRSERSGTSHRRHSRRQHDSERRRRPEDRERRHSGSSVASRKDRDRGQKGSAHLPERSHHRPPRAQTVASGQSHSAPTSPSAEKHPERRSMELVRRRTDMDMVRLSETHPRAPVRSASTTAIDMDLAYGDYHPSSIAPIVEGADEKELLTLVDRVKLILDEANCAQYSVKVIIEHLQKNPDAMAAVALTLAEISNVASKMAPSVLVAMKGSAPAVFALLASPQFLIAAGVGIGVTVVMFGGYKIIKKIKAKNASAAGGKEGSMDEMLEINGDEFNRINAWRRGITAPGDNDRNETASVGTSVEGEFITPHALAASMRGMETRDDILSGLSDKERKKVAKQEAKDAKKKTKRSDKLKDKDKDKGRKRSGLGTDIDDAATTTTTSSSRSPPSYSPADPRKALVKAKKPSPLRRLLA